MTRREQSRAIALEIVADYGLQPGTTAYVQAHRNVYRERGAPTECETCGENDPGAKYEWATTTKDYWNPFDYRRLCIRCHRSEDQRKAHDKREDHEWEDGAGQRCAICKRRDRRRHYERLKEDPERLARLRKQNRMAVVRYRTRQKGGDANVPA